MVKPSGGSGRISQNQLGNGQDWSKFVREQVGLAKIFPNFGIGQIFLRSYWDWSDFQWKWAQLIIRWECQEGQEQTGFRRITPGAIGIAENLFRCIRDWSSCLGGANTIGQSFLENLGDWSEILQKQTQSIKFSGGVGGLVRIPSRKGRNGIKQWSAYLCFAQQFDSSAGCCKIQAFVKPINLLQFRF